MSTINHNDWNPVQSTIASVLGGPDGTTTNLGYNTGVTSSQVAAGTKITGTQWNALRADINNAYVHQTGSNSDLTTRNNAYKITAADLTQISARATTAYNNRTAVGGGQLTFTGNSASISGFWASSRSGNTSLTWGTNASMRGFFNGGGYITITASHSGDSGGLQNQSWTNLCNNMGTIVISAYGCSQSGQSWNGGFNFTNGVYNHDGYNGTLFTINDQDANYTANYFRIDVGFPALMSGNSLAFIHYFVDAHTGKGGPPDNVYGPDAVDGTLQINYNVYYPYSNSPTIGVTLS